MSRGQVDRADVRVIPSMRVRSGSAQYVAAPVTADPGVRRPLSQEEYKYIQSNFLNPVPNATNAARPTTPTPGTPSSEPTTVPTTLPSSVPELVPKSQAVDTNPPPTIVMVTQRKFELSISKPQLHFSTRANALSFSNIDCHASIDPVEPIISKCRQQSVAILSSVNQVLGCHPETTLRDFRFTFYDSEDLDTLTSSSPSDSDNSDDVSGHKKSRWRWKDLSSSRKTCRKEQYDFFSPLSTDMCTTMRSEASRERISDEAAQFHDALKSMRSKFETLQESTHFKMIEWGPGVWRMPEDPNDTLDEIGFEMLLQGIFDVNDASDESRRRFRRCVSKSDGTKLMLDETGNDRRNTKVLGEAKDDRFETKLLDVKWSIRERFDAVGRLYADDSDSDVGGDDCPPSNLAHFFNDAHNTDSTGRGRYELLDTNMKETQHLSTSSFHPSGKQFNLTTTRNPMSGMITDHLNLPGCGDTRGVTGLSEDDVKRIWSSRGDTTDPNTRFKIFDHVEEHLMPKWPTMLLTAKDACIESPYYRLDYSTVEGVAQPSHGGFWEEIKDYCNLQLPRAKWILDHFEDKDTKDPEDPVNYLNGVLQDLDRIPDRWSKKTFRREQAELFYEEEMEKLREQYKYVNVDSDSTENKESHAFVPCQDESSELDADIKVWDAYDIAEELENNGENDHYYDPKTPIRDLLYANDEADWELDGAVDNVLEMAPTYNDPISPSAQLDTAFMDIKFKRWGFNSPKKKSPKNEGRPTNSVIELDRDLSGHAMKIVDLWDNTIPKVYHRYFNIKLLTNKSMWDKEGYSEHCHGCYNSFHQVLFRRHHCRMCGHAFCGSCSPFKVRLSPHCIDVRVCMLCFKTGMVRTALEKLFHMNQGTGGNMNEELKMIATALNTDHAIHARLKKKMRDIYDEFLNMRTYIQTCSFLEAADFEHFDPYLLDHRYGEMHETNNAHQIALPSLLVDTGALMKKIVDGANELQTELARTKAANMRLIELNKTLMQMEESIAKTAPVHPQSCLDQDPEDTQSIDAMRDILECYKDKHAVLLQAYQELSLKHQRSQDRGYEDRSVLADNFVPRAPSFEPSRHANDMSLMRQSSPWELNNYQTPMLQSGEGVDRLKLHNDWDMYRKKQWNADLLDVNNQSQDDDLSCYSQSSVQSSHVSRNTSRTRWGL